MTVAELRAHADRQEQIVRSLPTEKALGWLPVRKDKLDSVARDRLLADMADALGSLQPDSLRLFERNWLERFAALGKSDA